MPTTACATVMDTTSRHLRRIVAKCTCVLFSCIEPDPNRRPDIVGVASLVAERLVMHLEDERKSKRHLQRRLERECKRTQRYHEEKHRNTQRFHKSRQMSHDRSVMFTYKHSLVSDLLKPFHSYFGFSQVQRAGELCVEWRCKIRA